MSLDSNITQFDTLCPNRTIGPSGKENSVARKRYQHGRVFLKGKKKEKWVGRYREDVVEMDGNTRRVRRSVILGTKRELPTKRLAERRLDAILARINCLDYRPGRAAMFGEFIERWKTEVLTTQKPSSARAVRSHLKCYIMPELGKLRLDQFGVENQQMFITRMPERATEKAVSRKTILNVLGTLSTILTTARDWGYNCEQISLTKLRLPPRGTAYEAPHFTVEQVQKILAIAQEPWRTMFCIFMMDGLRAGEALGLQWPDIDFERNLLHIRRSAWYGRLQTAKSESSETVLPIPNPLLKVSRLIENNGNRTRKAFFLLPEITDHPPPTKSWNITSGRFLTRSRSTDVASTHFVTPIPRSCSTLGLHQKSYNVSFVTPMRGRRWRFTGMS